MHLGRPERFGETSPIEKETIDEIIFRREAKQQTFQGIADDLNCQNRLPRRAPKWTWGLIRHVYLCNAKSTERVINVNP